MFKKFYTPEFAPSKCIPLSFPCRCPEFCVNDSIVFLKCFLVPDVLMFHTINIEILKFMNIVCCVLKQLSHVRLLATPWAVTCQAPLSMEFSRQEYCIELPCPPPGDLPDSGIEPAFLIYKLNYIAVIMTSFSYEHSLKFISVEKKISQISSYSLL